MAIYDRVMYEQAVGYIDDENPPRHIVGDINLSRPRAGMEVRMNHHRFPSLMSIVLALTHPTHN